MIGGAPEISRQLTGIAAPNFDRRRMRGPERRQIVRRHARAIIACCDRSQPDQTRATIALEGKTSRIELPIVGGHLAALSAGLL